MAWLNVDADIRLATALSPGQVIGPLLDDLDADFTAADIAVVHLKAIVNSEAGYVKAAVCANGQEPVVEGNLDASPALKHNLCLNLRALGTAAQVQAVVERNLAKIDGRFEKLQISCFHPAAPKPERRVAERMPFP